MENIIKACTSLLVELHKFNDSIIFLGPKIEDKRLEIFEKDIGFELALDFKYIVTAHNGISLSGTEIYGLDKELRGSSLDEVYKYEHNAEIYNAMPKHFLPFSPDGRGNHYCLNLSKLKNGLCPVVFWQHDFIYKSIEEVEECNDEFISWVKEIMIESALEDYNYDGSER